MTLLRAVALIGLCAAAAAAQAPKTKNIVLVTADGLRWQEFLHGIDPTLMNEKAAGMAGGFGR